MISRELAEHLHKRGRTGEAIDLLDGLGDRLHQTGDKDNLMVVVNQILSMNPPNAAEYRMLLEGM